MRYKNISGSNIQIPNGRILGPNAELELTQEQENHPEVVVMVKDLSWLVPIAQEVVGDFIQGEVNKIEGNEVDPFINNFNFDVNVPIVIGGKVYIPTENGLGKVDKDKLLAEAVERANKKKTTKTWNPMDDAAELGEPDFLGGLQEVNSLNQYGNVEHQLNKRINPLTHMGGTENDDADIRNMSTAGYVPHHPEDLAQYNAPSKLPKVKPSPSRMKSKKRDK